MRIPGLVLLALLLASCATQPKPVVQAPPALPGMDQLIGQGVEAADRILGIASLDRREGPARQRQYAGACVLDLFYYPSSGSVPVATYASARMPDGRAMAPAECLSLLIRSRPG